MFNFCVCCTFFNLIIFLHEMNLLIKASDVFVTSLPVVIELDLFRFFLSIMG